MGNKIMKIDIKEIPAMPHIVLDVIRFDPSATDASSTTLSQIIQVDKGMASSILKVSNSAYYGQSGRVKTLKDAITLLGLKATKNLVLLLTGGEMFSRLKSESFRLLIHEQSILTALIGHDIAKPLGVPALRDDCFLYGLLHNIGMSIIALNATDIYNKLLNQYMTQGNSLVELENTSLETDHKQIGALTFNTWKMPESGVEVITQYDFDPTAVATISEMTRIVGVAANLARKLIALPMFPDWEAREKAVLTSFGKGPEVIDGFNGKYYEMIQDHPFYELAMEM